MALNVDCLLHVLKRCWAQDVCNVSRTSKSVNALLNRHIKILPQTHKSLLIKVHMVDMIIKCQQFESQQVEHFGAFLEYWETGLNLEYFLEHWRYVVVDEVVVLFAGSRHNSSLVEKCFEGLKSLNYQSLTLSHECGSTMFVNGPEPSELRRILESAEGGIFRLSSRNRISLETADYKFLLDCLLDNANSVRIYGYNSRPELVSSFIEQLLKEASAPTGNLASFFLTFTFPPDTTSNFAEDLAERICRFASVKKPHLNTQGYQYYRVLFSGSKTMVAFQYLDGVKVFQLGHADDTLKVMQMGTMFLSMAEQSRKSGIFKK